MFENLNQKQMEILLFIKNELETKGYPPSVREICQAVSLKSTSTVHTYLNRLEELSYIRRDPTKPRAIEMLYHDPDQQSPPKLIHIPLVGQVTAGNPILAVENIENVYPLPLDWFQEKEYFMLTVEGDSMMNIGILNKDIIIVEKTNAAKNGDIVVALVDEEYSTVKRFFKEKDHIRLQPENDAFEPIISRNVTILGKVQSLFRSHM